MSRQTTNNSISCSIIQKCLATCRPTVRQAALALAEMLVAQPIKWAAVSVSDSQWAERARCSRRSIIRAKQELRALGILQEAGGLKRLAFYGTNPPAVSPDPVPNCHPPSTTEKLPERNAKASLPPEPEPMASGRDAGFSKAQNGSPEGKITLREAIPALVALGLDRAGAVSAAKACCLAAGQFRDLLRALASRFAGGSSIYSRQRFAYRAVSSGAFAKSLIQEWSGIKSGVEPPSPAPVSKHEAPTPSGGLQEWLNGWLGMLDPHDHEDRARLQSAFQEVAPVRGWYWSQVLGLQGMSAWA